MVTVVGSMLGCADMAAHSQDPGWSYLLPEVNSTVTVNARLPVPAERARVFLQRGKVLGWGGVNRFEPHCNFELRRLSEGTLAVEPGVFNVVSVDRLIEQVVMMESVRVASTRLSGMEDDGSPMDVTMGVRMNLFSEEQPDVLRLTCYGAEAEPARALPPSILEMVAALGDQATLQAKLPGGR